MLQGMDLSILDAAAPGGFTDGILPGSGVPLIRG
jgi:hypothetical protein